MINEDRMGSEHNMAGRLPEPPAPSPEAREAAIARALQQFDRANEDAAQDSGPHLLAAASASQGRRSLGRPGLRYLVAASLAAFIAVPVGWLYLKDTYQLENRPIAPKVQPEKTTPEPPPADSRSIGDRSGAAVPPAALPPAAAPTPSLERTPSAAPAQPPAPSFAPAEQAAPAPRAVQRSESGPAPAAPSAPGARKQAADAVARQGDLGACGAPDPEGKIIGCTRVIEDRARGTADRRQAFLERGMAYARRGELDRAIGDFTEAIKLDPDNAAAFYNRSLAYRAKGDHDRARADCTAASGLDLEYRSRCAAR